MKSIEYFRRTLFWIWDYLKGQPVKSHLSAIRSHFENSRNEDEMHSQNRLLNSLLRHAKEKVSYYKSLGDNSKFNDFPVVNKGIIKLRRADFLSDGFNNLNLYSVTTSGSTGTPFEVYQDRRKKLRNTADTIFFSERAGYQLGKRLFYLKIWVQKKMRSKWIYYLQNIVPIDVIRLNDSEIIQLLELMNKYPSSVGILGYSSALELLCKYLDKHPEISVKKNVSSIIAMSESLNEYTKVTMEKYFGVPVVSRYSNLENGILAQQETDGSGKFLLNTASYKIEILDMDYDEPVPDGVLGRIVVTDLFNYAMPMIRYDTGDLGSMVPSIENDLRRYLSVVEGRKLDVIYDTRGGLVSSYIVYKNMWRYTEINQYQLIQEDKREYTFKINTDQKFNREGELISEFKLYLGEDAIFNIEYVTEIPLLASGKRKKIVNNYIKN